MISTSLVDFLKRFNLTLSSGSHPPVDPRDPNCKVCLQEAEALRAAWVDETAPFDWRAVWTDTPATAWADLRPLNDAPWSSDEVRAQYLAPLEDRLREVPPEKRLAMVKRVGLHHIRVLLPIALRAAAKLHPDLEHKATLEEAAVRCETATEATDATRAAEAAKAVARVAAAAYGAAWTAARADAGDAAYVAAHAAAHAADDACPVFAADAATDAAVCADAAARAANASEANADAVLIEAVRGWNAALLDALRSAP